MAHKLTHYDHNRAAARIAVALMDAGWQVNGYKPDESDCMTDYHSPSNWCGVAIHPDGATFVCRMPNSENSGRTFQDKEPIHVPCMHCHATGQEPDGWTLEQARANPKEYHRRRLVREHGHEAVDASRVFTLVNNVVSPIPFKDGVESCHKCSGSGQCYAGQRVVREWTYPVFQPNPPRSFWHVEKDGNILRSGYFKAEWCEYQEKEAVPLFVAEIGTIISGGTPAIISDTPGEATIRHNEAKGGLEVIFPTKPAHSVIDGLKSMGFRWSRSQGLWYTRYNERIEQNLRTLLG